jgi:hypothetical protein
VKEGAGVPALLPPPSQIGRKRASSFAEASVALLFWLRNDGIATAARMPMIRMTTRSSIRVKPPLI